jgi:hypothetical protein
LERIRDFVTALRSGEYRQIKYQLSTKIENGNEFGYCCEGVAVERHGPALGYVVSRNENGALRAINTELVVTNGSVLTAPARFWHDMGLGHEIEDSFVFELPDGLKTRPSDNNNDHVNDDDDDDDDDDDESTNTIAYAKLNDDGFTFDQIADLIEWQFLAWCRD